MYQVLGLNNDAYDLYKDLLLDLKSKEGEHAERIARLCSYNIQFEILTTSNYNSADIEILQKDILQDEGTILIEF